MSPLKKISIFIYALHPIMYQTPIFRQFQTRYGEEANLEVFFGSDLSLRPIYFEETGTTFKPDTPDLLEGFNYKILQNFTFKEKSGFFSRFNPGIIWPLLFRRPSVVLIHGYETTTAWMLLLICLVLRIKLMWRGEVTLKDQDKIRNKNFRQNVRHFILKRFLSCFDVLLYSCRGNKEFIQHIVGPSCGDKLVEIPCAVNNDFFKAENDRLYKSKNQIRLDLGVADNEFVIAFCARLTSRKNPLDLLEAVAMSNMPNLVILFIGDGPLRSSLEKKASYLGVKTIFTGFVNQSEVSRYYIVSDCAVNISSYDPSPKALNEAMNFSLPVIVTEVIGTAYDLVDDGGNGFIIKNSDVDTLSKRLKFLNSNRLIAKEMGERSFSRISRYTMDTNAQSLWSAASLAVGRK